MEGQRFDLHQLSDRQVLDRLLKLHLTSAEVMADLLCHLAEVERRKLHLHEATRSIFAYAVEVLHCTEDQAWRRVTAAQTAAKFPVVFEWVASGELTLTAVNMLRGVLTEANHLEVLREARHKTKAELEVIIARLAPKADVPTRLARVAEKSRPTTEAAALELRLPVAPSRSGAPELALSVPVAAPVTAPVASPTVAPPVVASTPAPQPERAALAGARPEPARLAPLSPERWRLSLTIGAEAQRALRTARDLTPDRDLARIVERAVIEYAEKLEARKLAKLKGRKRRSTTSDGVTTATASADSVATPSASTSVATPVGPDSTIAPPSIEPPPGPDSVVPTSALARARGPTRRQSAEHTGSGAASHRPPIPRAFVRAIFERDGGRCGYVCPETGRRCSETANLQIHHIVLYARGGGSRVSDYGLRCAAHNAYEAELDFGADHMVKAIARRRRARGTPAA